MTKIKSIQWLTAIVSIFFAATVSAIQTTSLSHDMQILSIADIHFDPFLSCHEQTPCPLIQSLRAAPASAWPSILSKHDQSHPEYHQDSDYALLVSALAAAKQAAERNQVKTVFVLGDFLGHDYRELYKKYSHDSSRAGYKDFAHKTMMFLTDEIGKTFPDINVYAAVGNNDSYLGDYRFDKNGAFFSDTDKLFAALVKDPANKAAIHAEFPVGGYYAVNITPDTKLIMLNTVLFSAKAKPAEAAELAQRQLTWLHQQLQSAKEKNQYVMIAMHIPAGVDVYATLKYRLFRLIQFWNTEYTDKFEAELKEYSPELVAIFAGHLHSDWFQMLKIDDRNTIPVTGTPSISPIFGNNPGFKIYQYSSADGKLRNFETYYYPLNTKADWGVEYSFDKIYQPNCRDCTLPAGMERLQPANVLADYYKRFYAVSTTSQPITTKWMPYYWCAVQEVDLDKYKKCIA